MNGKYLKVLISLGILFIFWVWSPHFFQPFYTPRLFVYLFTGLVALWTLFLTRKEIEFPYLSTFGVLAGLWRFQFAVAFIILVSIINLPPSIYRFLLIATIGISIGQAIIGLIQISPMSFVLPSNLVYNDSPAIGTIGNPEFLATFLGLGILLCLFFFTQQTDRKIKWVWVLVLILLACGLVATKSKGTLLFMVLFGLWFVLKNTKKAWTLIWISALIMGYLSWFSIKSRLMLWMVSLFLFGKNWLWGIGIGQFNNHYINTLGELFTRYPFLSDTFGTYSANVQHGHNLIFHYAAELGILGVVLSVLVYTGFWMIFRKEENPILKACLIFLIYKSLYTVIFESITGLLCTVIIFALVLKPKFTTHYPINKKVLLLPAVLISAMVFWTSWQGLADYHYQKGMKALYLGNRPKAEQAFNQTLQKDPTHAEAMVKLAYIAYSKTHFDKAESLITQAINTKKDINTLKKSAHILYEMQKFDKAYPLYAQLTKAYPEHLTPLVRMAQIDYRKGNYERAKELAQKVLAINPRIKSTSYDRNRGIATALLKNL